MANQSTKRLTLVVVAMLVVALAMMGVFVLSGSPSAPVTHAELTDPASIEIFESINIAVQHGDDAAAFLQDLTYDDPVWIAEFKSDYEVADYYASVSAVLFYAVYNEDSESWSIDTTRGNNGRILGYTNGDAQSAYAATDIDDFTFVAGEGYIVSLDWDSYGSYEYGWADILINNISPKVVHVDFDSMSISNSKYGMLSSTEWFDAWFATEIVDGDDVRAAWYYLTYPDSVMTKNYISATTDVGTYSGLMVELQGDDADKYELIAEYPVDPDAINPGDRYDCIPEITIIKNTTPTITKWLFNGTELADKGSIPYTGHTPAITPVTNVGAEVKIAWSAGGDDFAATQDEFGNWCIMDENVAYLTDGEPIDSLDNYGTTVYYWAIATWEETANYDALTTESQAAFFCFTIERRTVSITWLNDDITDIGGNDVENLYYNGGAQYPMYRIDLEGICVGDVERPTTTAWSDALNPELGDITPNGDFHRYTVNLDDYVNYKFEGLSENQAAQRCYRINKGTVELTITQKDDAHFYYRKATAGSAPAVYFESFDFVITANGSTSIFVVDPFSLGFEDSQDNWVTPITTEAAFNHPGEYRVKASTSCFVLATGFWDSGEEYYVYEDGKMRPAELGNDIVDTDTMMDAQGKDIYVIGDDPKYYNKSDAIGTLTIEKAPVYVRTTDSFTFDEDTDYSPDEDSYKFYIYEAGVAANLWDTIYDDWYVEITGSYIWWDSDTNEFYSKSGDTFTKYTGMSDGDDLNGYYYKATPFAGSTSMYHDAGAYDLGATIYDGAYCTWADDYVMMINEGETVRDEDAVFTIAPYEVTVDIVEPDWTYSGSEKNVTASYTNTEGETVGISTFSYAYVSGAEGYVERLNVTGDAFYAVFEITDTNYVAESNSDYTLIDGGRSVKTANFILNKKSFSYNTFPNTSSSYGDEIDYLDRPTVYGYVEDAAPSPTSTNYYWRTSSFEYPINTNDGEWIDGSVTPFERYSNAGTYYIYWVSEYQNYMDATNDKTHVINKVALTVVAEDKNVTYGDAAPSYTYYLDGFVDGEAADTLLSGTLTGAPTLSSIYAQFSNAGEYAINVTSIGTLAATNYTFSMENVTAGTLTVSKADYRFPRGIEQKYGADGKIVYTGGNLSANGKIDIVYGTLRDADVVSVYYKLHDAEDIPANWYTSIPTLENAAAGYYTIDYKFENGNYNAFASTFTITVSPANVGGHYQPDPQGSFIYSGSAQTPALLNTLETVDGSDIELTFSLDGENYNLTAFPQFTNVSDSRTVYWMGAAANHNSVGGSFMVTMAPKTVTVTFNDLADLKKTYDGSNLTPSGANADVYGVVDGQSLSVVFDTVNNSKAGNYTGHFTLVAGANTTLSNYTLQASEVEPYPGAVNGNYSVSAEVGYVNVAIQQRTITYDRYVDGALTDTAEYNGAAKEFSLRITNKVGEDDVYLYLSTTKNGAGAATQSQSNEGDYPYYVILGGAEAIVGSYKLEAGLDEKVTFHIASKVITVSYALGNYGEFTYGDTTGFNTLEGINSKANFYGMLSLSDALTGGEAVADVIDLRFKKGGVVTPIGATADVGKYYLYATIKEGVTNYAFNLSVNSDEKAYINLVPKTLTADWNIAANGTLHEDYGNKWFEFVYNGAGQKAVADPVGVVGSDDVGFAYGEYSEKTNVSTNGSYYTTIVGLNGAKAGNYTFNTYSANAEHNYKIIPKPITVQWSNTEFTYDGEKHAPTVGITGGSIVSGDALDISLVEPTKQINANAVNAHYTATVSLTGAKAANYTITNSTCDFTIARRAITPVFKLDGGDDFSIVYDGTEHTLTATAEGCKGDVIIFNIDASRGKMSNVNALTAVVTAGSYYADGDDLYHYNYVLEENVSQDWSVVKRVVTIKNTNEAPITYTYGDDISAFSMYAYLTVDASNDGLSFVPGDTMDNVVFATGFIYNGETPVYKAGIKNVGSYAFAPIVMTAKATNYTIVNNFDENAALVVEPKEVTVTYTSTHKEVTYGDMIAWTELGSEMAENGYYLDFDGIVDGDNAFDSVYIYISDGKDGEIDMDDTPEVGCYALVVEGDDDNYEWIITLGSEAYLQINKAKITVVPNGDQGKIYGNADGEITFKAYVDEFEWNEDDSVYEKSVTELEAADMEWVFVGALARAKGENVDSYPITIGTLALAAESDDEDVRQILNRLISNYEIFFTEGESFAIRKRPITLSYNKTAPLMYTYGDADVYDLNPYEYIDGYLTGFAMSDLAVLQADPLAIFRYIPLKINGIPAQDLNGQNFGYAATYNLTIDPATVNANYEATVELGDNAKLIIEKADLLIIANYKSVTYGEATPEFTVTYAGWRYDDETKAKNLVFGGELAFDCERTLTSPIGNYAITPKGYTAGNYRITYVPGTLKVNRAELDCTFVIEDTVYGTAVKAPVIGDGIGLKGFKNGDTAALVKATDIRLFYVLKDGDKTAGEMMHEIEAGLTSEEAVEAFLAEHSVFPTQAGTYYAYLGINDFANYSGIEEFTEFTIAKKVITVTADNKESDYAADLAKLTFTDTGIEEGDEVATIATDADKTKIGEYAITLTSTNDPNYDVTLVNGKYTVKAKAGKVETNAAGEKVVEQTEDIKAEIKEAKAEEGVSIKNMIRNVIEAAADAPVATLEIEVTEEATVAFDKAALKKLAENADVKISYKETKKADVDQTNSAIKNAEFVIEVSLAGATFEGGKATITTAFEDNAPGGKKAVLYYVAEDGTKTEVEATFAGGKLTFVTTHFSTYIVEYKLTGGSIAGIVIACVVGVAGIAAGVFFLLKKKKGAKKDEAATPADAE